MRVIAYLFALLAAPAFAAPQPKPPIPTSIVFSHGTDATRTLFTGRNQLCAQNVQEFHNGSLRRFNLGSKCPNQSFVQYPDDGIDVGSHWVYAEPVCGQKPTPFVQFFECPFGTSGPGFNETHDWTCVNGVWVATAWVPPWTPPDPPTPPAGVCVPHMGMQPAVNVSGDPMLPKPARGVTLTTRYGTSINRITDHAADTGTSMMRNDYSRRQPVNLDGTKLLTSFNDEYWYVYDISDPAHARYVERLNGPAGDAEIQWSETDADALLYLDRNGGTVLRQVKVSTNASSVVWDFGPIVRAFWPASSHCWTKSEGSPSADGRLWGLMCEDGNFNPLGFVVLDIVAKTATWHRDNSNRPDHVSIDPTGQYFVAGWNGSPGVISWNLATGVQTTLNSNAEHSDLGSCAGRGFYASMDYGTNLGDIFFTYLDDGVRHVVGNVYGHPNPIYGTNYGMHYSAKAFGVCGFLASNVGTPPANMAWYSLVAPYGPFGVGENYDVDVSYFDEVQGAISRDGKSFFYNDNFGGPSQSGDVYRGTMPP